MFCDNDENYEVLNDENDNGENDKAEVPALNNNSTIRSNNKNAQANAYNPPSVKGSNDHDPFPLSRHNL